MSLMTCINHIYQENALLKLNAACMVCICCVFADMSILRFTGRNLCFFKGSSYCLFLKKIFVFQKCLAKYDKISNFSLYDSLFKYFIYYSKTSIFLFIKLLRHSSEMHQVVPLNTRRSIISVHVIQF